MTDLFPRILFPAMWVAWGVYWAIAARGAKATRRRESLGSRLAHMPPLAAALWLVWVPRLPLQPLDWQLLPWSAWEFWSGAAVTAGGLAFASWARMHIGRNWSGTVTLKEEHELVSSGPYALVRHPIYTGLLLAIVGSAMARDEWRGVLAVALAWAALWRKLRIEERWMQEQFGERYADYRRRVPALVPSLRRTPA